MSQAPEDVRKRMDALDAAGNTTKALTKGYAIGSAALAVFLLFNAYMSDISRLIRKTFDTVNIASIPVFVGALLGAMLIFLFAGFAIRAVSKTAQYVINEVRTQFKDPAIMAGTKKPDYARVIDITTLGALKNMVIPGILAVAFPIFIGVTMKYEALGGSSLSGPSPVSCSPSSSTMEAAHGTTRRNTSRAVPMAVRAAKPTRQPSSATRWATRSRTRQAPRSTCSSSYWRHSRSCLHRCLSENPQKILF